MPADPDLRKRAQQIALEVDRLYAQPQNKPHFHSQIEAYKPEAAERERRQKQDEEAERSAVDAIWEELQAVQAGNARPRLTDPDHSPGPDWRLGGGHPTKGDQTCVEGWVPVEVFERWTNPKRWTIPNPSPAAMFTLLAALHDERLPDSPQILPVVYPSWVEFWCIGAQRGNAQRMDTLESYLNHVKSYLDGVQKPERAAPLPATKKPADRARLIALKVDGLYRGNPVRWKKQWADAMQEADTHYERCKADQQKRRKVLAAIVEEIKAVKAGIAKRRLTDSAKPPGKGWRWAWETVFDPANGQRWGMVEAWLPPDVPESDNPPAWPGPDPSPAAMYLTLAVLHDAALPNSPKIMDPATADSGAMGYIEGQGFDDGFVPRNLEEAFDRNEGVERGEFTYTDAGVARLKTFLNAVCQNLAGETGKAADDQDAGARTRVAKNPNTAKPILDTENRLRVKVKGKWHNLTDEGWALLSVLFEAKGGWVPGKTLGERPDRVVRRMVPAVRRIIKSHRHNGYHIPSLLSK